MTVFTHNQLKEINRIVMSDEDVEVFNNYIITIALGEDAPVEHKRIFIKGHKACMEIANFTLSKQEESVK